MIEITTNTPDLSTNQSGLACRHHVSLDLGARRLAFGETHVDINGTDVDVAHGHVIEWVIAPQPTDVQQTLASEIRADVEILCDEYDTRWDGSNIVASWSDGAAAAAALNRIEASLAPYLEEDQEWITAMHIIDLQRVESGIEVAFERARAEFPGVAFDMVADDDRLYVRAALADGVEFQVSYADLSGEARCEDPVSDLLDLLRNAD